MVISQSPDGKAIYYRKARQGGDVLAVRDIASGSERVLIENNVYATVNIRFSRDGKKLAMSGGRYYLGILDIASGQVKDIHKPADPTSGPRVAGMDWTADDQEIFMLMELSGGAYEAWLFSVDGGDPVRQPLSTHAHRPSISRDGRHIGMIQTESHNQVWALENFLPRQTAGN